MTEGSEAGHIVRFALPLLGGNLLQQTYNIVDTVIVGTFLGDSALAAVGATGYALVNGTAAVSLLRYKGGKWKSKSLVRS